MRSVARKGIVGFAVVVAALAVVLLADSWRSQRGKRESTSHKADKEGLHDAGDPRLGPRSRAFWGSEDLREVPSQPSTLPFSGAPPRRAR